MSRDGQGGNIYDHAFKGAATSNFIAMALLNNLTRDQSYVGKSFPLNSTLTLLTPGQMAPTGLVYLSRHNSIPDVNLDIACTGFGGMDEANITNTGIHCSMFAGTPERSDGGDSRLMDNNSTWTQSLYACASVTRARIQTISFSFDGRPDLSKLRITRRNTDKPALWATERTSLYIRDVSLLWGYVDDSYEDDPSLSTIRSEVFYVPAGGSDLWGVVGAGSPNTVPAAAWAESYSIAFELARYNGQKNYALLHKFESTMKNDSINGPARIRNLIWTDILANNIVGNATGDQLTVAAFQPSISYQLVFAIPAIILFIWLFAFLAAVVVLASGSLTISYIRDLINHTSVGRAVVGDSRLMVTRRPPAAGDDSTPFMTTPHSDSLTSSLMVGDHSTQDDGAAHSPSIDLDSQSWAQTTGLSLVKFTATELADLKLDC